MGENNRYSKTMVDGLLKKTLHSTAAIDVRDTLSVTSTNLRTTNNYNPLKSLLEKHLFHRSSGRKGKKKKQPGDNGISILTFVSTQRHNVISLLKSRALFKS